MRKIPASGFVGALSPSGINRAMPQWKAPAADGGGDYNGRFSITARIEDRQSSAFLPSFELARCFAASAMIF
jgi:hypothetical protein